MIHRYCVWAFACFFALDPTVLAKEKEEPLPAPPPMAVGHNVSTYRGRSVQIPLRAVGRAPGQVKFLIRNQPRSGRLGPITIIDRKNAVVTYTHDERQGSGGDAFTFAVQAPDSPVSAQASISITISEEPSAFSVVHSLDFGKVLLGDNREDEVILRNTGGGVISGVISVAPPWKILTNPSYRLGRHEEQKVRIAFEPTDSMEITERLRFSHDGRAVVTLNGTGVAPLAFVPEKEIELRAEKGSTVRTADLIVRNLTDHPRTVEIETPDHVAPTPEFTLPPNGEQRVSLHSAGDFIEAIEGEVKLSSEGYRKKIPLRGYALAPFLEADPKEGFAFGDVLPGRRYKGVLRLKNTGGLDARLTSEFPSGTLLTPDPATVVIASGEMRVFELTFEPMSTGDIHEEIVIRVTRDQALRIPIHAKSMAPPPARQPKSPITSAVVVPESREPAAGKAEPTSSIPAIKDIKVLKALPHEVELGWTKPAANAVGTVVEYRGLMPTSQGEPEIKWTEWQGAKFFEEDALTIARFENLPASRVWYIRIISIDELGRRSAPSSTIQLISSRAPDYRIGWWLLGTTLLAGSVLAYRYFRKKRLGEAEHEADRIAKLESRK